MSSFAPTQAQIDGLRKVGQDLRQATNAIPSPSSSSIEVPVMDFSKIEYGTSMFVHLSLTEHSVSDFNFPTYCRHHDIRISGTLSNEKSVEQIKRLCRSQHEAWRYWHTWESNKKGSEPPPGPSMIMVFDTFGVDDFIHPVFKYLLLTRKRTHITILVVNPSCDIPSSLRDEFDIYMTDRPNANPTTICPDEDTRTFRTIYDYIRQKMLYLVYANHTFMCWSCTDTSPLTIRLQSPKRKCSNTMTVHQVKKRLFSTTDALLMQLDDDAVPLDASNTLVSDVGKGTMSVYEIDCHTTHSNIRPSIGDFDIIDRIVSPTPFTFQVNTIIWKGEQNSIGQYTWFSDTGIPLIAMQFSVFDILAQSASNVQHLMVYGRVLSSTSRHDLVQKCEVDQKYLVPRIGMMYTRPRGIYFMVDQTKYEIINGRLVDQPSFNDVQFDIIREHATNNSTRCQMLKGTPYPIKHQLKFDQLYPTPLDNGTVDITPTCAFQLARIYSDDDRLSMLSIESGGSVQLRIPLQFLRREGKYYIVDTPITLPPGPTYTLSIENTLGETSIDFAQLTHIQKLSAVTVPRWTFSTIRLNKGHNCINIDWMENMCHGVVLNLGEDMDPDDLISVCVSIAGSVKKITPQTIHVGQSQHKKVYVSFGKDVFPYTLPTPIPFKNGINMSRVCIGKLYIGSRKNTNIGIAVLSANFLNVKGNICGNLFTHCLKI